MYKPGNAYPVDITMPVYSQDESRLLTTGDKSDHENLYVICSAPANEKMTMKRQIIAIGGSSGSQPAELVMERYIIAQVPKRNPKVCFLPTASGDSDYAIRHFYDVFNRLDCTPSHLSLFDPWSSNLESIILGQDCIFVGGGNTKNLLALWREWDLNDVLARAWQSGIVLAGVSAGCICWFHSGVTDSIPGSYISLPCLGILKGSSCPHYDSDPKRRPAYHQLIASGQIEQGFAVDDGVALHFEDQKLLCVVSGRTDGHAYRVYKNGNKIDEEALEVIVIGAEQANP